MERQNTTAGVVQQDFTCVAVDLAAPTLAASPFTPSHETATPFTYSNPVSRSFLFQFNEAITKNTGSITMTSCPQCTSETVTIDVTSSSVVVKGAYALVTPPVDLSAGEVYSITIGAGSFKDASGNTFAA